MFCVRYPILVERATAIAPSSGLLAARQQVEQRRFPLTVRADQPDAILLVDLEAHTRKDQVRAIRLFYINNIHNWHKSSPVFLGKVQLLRIALDSLNNYILSPSFEPCLSYPIIYSTLTGLNCPH